MWTAVFAPRSFASVWRVQRSLFDSTLPWAPCPLATVPSASMTHKSELENTLSAAAKKLEKKALGKKKKEVYEKG